MTTPIPEPVPKDIQEKFVQSEWDLMWLAEHGMLIETAATLAKLRKETELKMNDLKDIIDQLTEDDATHVLVWLANNRPDTLHEAFRHTERVREIYKKEPS